MRQFGIIVAAAVLAGTVGACAYYPPRTYAYTSDNYYPGYYAPAPPAYYGYSYSPSWDFYRNYNGIHGPAEVSAM